MLNFDLLPTDENIKKTLLKDPIQRNNYLYNFLQLIDNINSNKTISLDGDWGSGKTFFIKQAYYCLLASNKYLKDFFTKKLENENCTTEDEKEENKLFNMDEINIINSSLDKELIFDRTFIPVYYNAWKNDNFTNPVLSLINTIVKSFINSGKFSGDINIKKAVCKIVNDIISAVDIHAELYNIKNQSEISFDVNGQKLSQVFDDFKNFQKPNYLQQFNEEEKLTNKINSLFENIAEEKGDKYIIFIDELDRCNPTFAVNFLEKIKHYFSNDKLIFVFSTNINELQHTIKNYYGNDFDGASYLDKFFDFRLHLPPLNYKNYFKYINYNMDIPYLSNNISNIIIYYNMTMRKINHYLSVFDIAYRSFYQIFNYNSEYNDNYEKYKKCFDFYSSYFLPLLVYLILFNPTEYNNFINGKNFDLFFSIMNLNKNDPYIKEFLKNSENISGSEPYLKGTLRYIYEKTFSSSISSNTFQNVVNMTLTIPKNLKTNLLDALTCLSIIETDNN